MARRARHLDPRTLAERLGGIAARREGIERTAERDEAIRLERQTFADAAKIHVEIDALQARCAVLEGAIQGLLAYEATAATLRGGPKNDCTCMMQSRDTERAYETGTCPHQAARAALPSSTPEHFAWPTQTVT